MSNFRVLTKNILVDFRCSIFLFYPKIVYSEYKSIMLLFLQWYSVLFVFLIYGGINIMWEKFFKFLLATVYDYRSMALGKKIEKPWVWKTARRDVLLMTQTFAEICKELETLQLLYKYPLQNNSYCYTIHHQI